MAYWGPTALTSQLRQTELASRFYRHLLQERTIGRAIRKAKRELSADPTYHEMLRTWVLLGDPALRWP